MKTRINQRQTRISSSGQVDQIKPYKTQGIKRYYANHSKDMQRLGVAQKERKQTQSKPRASPLHRWALGRQSLVEVRCCGGGWGEAWGDGAGATNAALRVTLPGTLFSALMRNECFNMQKGQWWHLLWLAATLHYYQQDN